MENFWVIQSRNLETEKKNTQILFKTKEGTTVHFGLPANTLH